MKRRTALRALLSAPLALLLTPQDVRCRTPQEVWRALRDHIGCAHSSGRITTAQAGAALKAGHVAYWGADGKLYPADPRS